MSKIRSNDKQVLRIYSEFLSEIMNDSEKATIYKIRLTGIEGDKMFIQEEKANFDFNFINTSDDFQFLMLSADENNFDAIVKMSIGICNIFGYTKNELLGKHINLIIPEQMQKAHKNILEQRVAAYKKQLSNYTTNYNNGINITATQIKQQTLIFRIIIN